MERRLNPLIGTGAVVWRPRTGTDQAWARSAVARGELQRILRTVYGPTGSLSPELKAAALFLADPDAVITSEAAAHFTWWPQLTVTTLTVARSQRARPAPGFEWEERAILPELVTQAGGLRVTSPALTVLDLIPSKGGNAIDEALRRKACTLDDMWNALALTPNRRGNAQRHILLHDSRDEPWSEAERHLHQHYRACDLPFDYATNHWVTLNDGRKTALDFAIPDLMLGFEADGFAYHGDRPAFEYDRDRDTDLAAQGWWVIRFTASFLDHEEAETRRRMTAIVRHRARALGVPWPTEPGDARSGTPRGGARR